MFNKLRFDRGLFDREIVESSSTSPLVLVSSVDSQESFGALRVLQESFIITPSITPTLTVSRIKKVKLKILVSGFQSIQVGRPGIRKTTYLGSVESRQSVSRVNVKRIIGITSIFSQEELPRIFYTIQEQFLIPQGVSSGQIINDVGSYVNRYTHGVVSSNAFGVLRANLILILDSFVSISSVSDVRPAFVIGAEGISSESVIEDIKVSKKVSLVSVPSSLIFGLARVNKNIQANSLVYSGSFNNPKINMILLLSGVTSEQCLSVPVLKENNPVMSIGSSVLFGRTKIILGISAGSVSTSESVGSIKVNEKVNAQGIASQSSLSSVYRVVKKVTPLSVLSSAVVNNLKVCKQQFIGCQGNVSAEVLGNIKVSCRFSSDSITSLSSVSNVFVGLKIKPLSIDSISVIGSVKVCREQFISAGSVDDFTSGILKVIIKSYLSSVEGLEDVNDISAIYKIRPQGINAPELVGNLSTRIILCSDSILTGESVESPFLFIKIDHNAIIIRESVIASVIDMLGTVNCMVNITRGSSMVVERNKSHDIRISKKDYHVLNDGDNKQQDVYIDISVCIEDHMVG